MATVDTHYLKAALQCAERQGFAAQTLLSQAGISPQQLQRPRTPVEPMARLVRHIWQQLDDEFMGCTEHRCKRGVFAMMARYALNYDSLQSILKQGVAFYNLFTDAIQMQLQQRGERAELEIRFTSPQADPDGFYREFWLVIWHRFSSWLIGRNIPLLQVDFDFAQPAHARELKTMFPCSHRFDQTLLRLSFPASFLALRTIRTQRELASFLRDSPSGLMTLPEDAASYRSRIRRRILEPAVDALELPTFEVLAQEFGLSAQTLRRRLRAEGSSYPRIKDELRLDLAIEKLVLSHLSVAEIASQLGFSEARAFTRAFRHWTGQTPSEYRRSNRRVG